MLMETLVRRRATKKSPESVCMTGKNSLQISRHCAEI